MKDKNAIFLILPNLDHNFMIPKRKIIKKKISSIILLLEYCEKNQTIDAKVYLSSL